MVHLSDPLLPELFGITCSFLSQLLDRYGYDRVDPPRDFTPTKWLEEKNQILEIRRLNIEEDPYGMMNSYDDINI